MKNLPDLGEQFQTLRKAAGKTQDEVALAAGMRQEALSRFERGRGGDFSLAKMLRLLQVLGMEMEFVPATRRPTLDSVLDERRASQNIGPGSR
ncbi:MAG: helix-turn-helix transcriptional regulator [Rhodoferax sp.]|uniref:helix-turn-helix domain-containing protein n=1 Tax=Rhodoferax sp. TaxID=50421 RepID=UPI0030164DA9